MRLLPAIFLLTTLAPAQKLEFDVATIKLNTTVPDVIDAPKPIGGRFHFPFNSLRMLIATAYNLKPFEILGGPSWIASNRYDVEAKSADPKPNEADFRLMMRNLLADRFHAEGPHERRANCPAFTLAPRQRHGSKLHPTPEGGCVTYGPDNPGPPLPPPGQPFNPPAICGNISLTRTQMKGGNVTMRELVETLTDLLAAPVTDNTNYTAPFDVHLDFTREGAPTTDDSPPSIFTAIQEQLGLRLEA